MEQWSGEQRAFIIEAYFRSNDSYTVARRQFCARYNIRRVADAPSKNVVKAWVEKFRNTGSARNQKHPGKPKIVRTAVNIAAVRRAVTRHPKRSARKLAQTLQISRSSMQRILKQDLHFHLYKIQLVQYLKLTDFPKRKRFCETMMNFFWYDGGLETVIFSDEAHFHLDGYVNKQNCRYWSPNNPHEKHAKQLHSKKVTVWCAMLANGIIGPYFFEDARGRALTVNSARYSGMIRTFFAAALQNVPDYDDTTWFQQDGATAHTAYMSINAVNELFPGRLISLHGDIEWPPRSPDLTPLDFFLWGYLKNRVYVDPPATIDQLKQRIRDEINNIPVALCQRVFQHLRTCLQECYEQDGRHMDTILFKK